MHLPAASPPKRRWRFASPNANSMPQGSSASAQRGEDEKEQVRQRRDKPTSPPGRCECTVFRRDHKEFQQLRGTCFMRCGISASLQKSCASGPRWLPATKTNRRLVLVFDPQQARDHSLLSARSASTFGHHSTFAQAVRFLPSSHLPAHASLAALLSRYQQCPYLQAISSPCAMRAVRQIKHY